jgi:L-iditol 2-dehydrogenase
MGAQRAERLMFAAVLHAPADLRYEQVKLPMVGDDEVLIHVRAAGICGSDLGRVMKTGTYTFPTIPGHEFCGVIAEVGKDVKEHAPGERAVVAPLLPCMRCEFCASGDYGMCDDYSYLGSRRDGAFAQFVAAPARNLLRLPDGVSFAEGALVEPAAVTLHGMIRVGINVGDEVAVLGCGPIGLFAIQFARIMGARRIIAADIVQDKLAVAKEVGADDCVDSSAHDAVEAITTLTKGIGVDVAIETAGVSQTQEQCIRSVKKRGRLLYLGTSHSDVILPPRTFERIVRNELSIFGAWNSYSTPFPGVEWRAAIDFAEKGALKMRPLISHTFDLSDAPRVFGDLSERRFSFTKVIFELP